MELNDLYHHTRIIKSLLTEQEIKELLKRIETFGEIHLKVRDYISTGKDEYGDKKEYKYKGYSVMCPCGMHHGGYYHELRLDENEKIKASDLKHKQDRAFGMLMNHITYHIRMNGSEEHINILRQVYGDKVTMFILENWAKTNMLVALKLKSIVEYMKRLMEIEQ